MCRQCGQSWAYFSKGGDGDSALMVGQRKEKKKGTCRRDGFKPQEWDKLWSMNKRIIDPVCPRHTGLLQQDLVPVDLVNGPTEPEAVTVPKHKKHPAAGVKTSIRTKVRNLGIVLWFWVLYCC